MLRELDERLLQYCNAVCIQLDETPATHWLGNHFQPCAAPSQPQALQAQVFPQIPQGV